MRRCRYKMVRGDAFSIAFLNVALPVIEDEDGMDKYEITDKDILSFVLGRKGRDEVLVKTYPGEIEKDGDTFFVNLTAEETEKIPCLLYRMQLIVDLEGLGEEVYTLVVKEMEVVGK